MYSNVFFTFHFIWSLVGDSPCHSWWGKSRKRIMTKYIIALKLMVYIYSSICKGVFNMTWGFYMNIVNNWQLFHVPFLLRGSRFWGRMVILCEAWLLWPPPGNLIASQRYEKYARHQVCDFEHKPLLNHTCMLDSSIPIVIALCVYDFVFFCCVSHSSYQRFATVLTLTPELIYFVSTLQASNEKFICFICHEVKQTIEKSCWWFGMSKTLTYVYYM